jgi:mannose/fructose/N-acetylgalactosamine-specific phosphotransferase system component IIC
VLPLIGLSLLGGALAVDNRASVRLMISQPICGGLLAGLVLGNPGDGFVAGALLQMLFLGMVPVRGIAAPDLALGGVAAGALYARLPGSMNAEAGAKGLILLLSLASALVVGVAGRALYRFWERRSYAFTEAALGLAGRGRFGLASALHFSTVLVHFAAGCAVTAAAYVAGAFVISHLVPAVAGGWCEPLASLPVLAPFIGAGALLLLNLTRVRLFLFIAGFCAVLVVAFFRG